MMKRNVEDIGIGNEIVWKDAVTDDLHIYTVESAGKSWGLMTSYIFTVRRDVDSRTVERRNLVIEEGQTVDTPDAPPAESPQPVAE